MRSCGRSAPPPAGACPTIRRTAPARRSRHATIKARRCSSWTATPKCGRSTGETTRKTMVDGDRQRVEGEERVWTEGNNIITVTFVGGKVVATVFQDH